MLGLKSLLALASLLAVGACAVVPPANPYSYYGVPAYSYGAPAYSGYYGAPTYAYGAPVYPGYPSYYGPYLGGPAVTLGFFGGSWGRRYGHW